MDKKHTDTLCKLNIFFFTYQENMCIGSSWTELGSQETGMSLSSETASTILEFVIDK